MNSDQPVNPLSLSIPDAAKVLAAAGKIRVTEEMIRADVEAGAPVGADGKINLVQYAAWLVREAAHGSD